MTESTRPDGAPWRIRDVAAYFGIAESTVRGYLSRDQMPAPDGRDQYGPWWHEPSITSWHRPGPGNRHGPRGHPPRIPRE